MVVKYYCLTKSHHDTGGGAWTYFLLPIRTCDLCSYAGHRCSYAGHDDCLDHRRPSLISGKVSLHPSYQRLRPLLLCRSLCLLRPQKTSKPNFRQRIPPSFLPKAKSLIFMDVTMSTQNRYGADSVLNDLSIVLA